MKFKNISALKRTAVMMMYAALIVILGNATSFAQNHSQRQERHDLKDHQRAERNYNNGYGSRDHQRQERRELKYEQRNERRVYNNNGGYYNNGGYNNNSGYYGNGGGYNNRNYDPYYNNRGNNNGRYNNGGYNNGGYYHRDSRNPVKRGIHHIFGGH